MKHSYLFSLLFLIATFSLYSQEDKKAEDDYAAYFKLPREAIYLHLNKTSYFTGEEIWFKSYTYDQKNQLTSKATTNINVGIYDEKGKQFKKALYQAENGVAHGNFLIDSTFTSGTYYIKAATNWMKNFKENDAYVQKIEIFTEEETKKEIVATEERFDFQFLPEGGHIVANTKSNVGFKVIDQNGKGVAVTGIVFDENKNEVASFQANALGLGKFSFQPKANEHYTAEIKLKDGTLLTKTLPKAKAKGVSMIVNNPFPDKIIINFSTNAATLASNPAKKYKVLIHQTGNLKTINFSFDTGNEKVISVAKNELFKGINTITLFDEDERPILERLFFNDFFVKKTAINVSEINKMEDSILLSVSELKLQGNANISISILPAMTEAYQPNHNIISNFYLKSYLKGTIQNPQYYFRDMDRKKKYELDILLLTQGWSRYNWNTIFSGKPTAKYRFENGITISGRVNEPTSGVKRLFFYTTKNHPSTFIDLDENQKFELTNLFLEKDEEVRFSYISKKGTFKKPKMYLQFSVANKEDQISEALLNKINTTKTNSADFTIPKNFVNTEAEQLGTVVLEAENKRLAYKDPFMIYPEVTDVTEEIYYRYYNVVQFLQMTGFNATQELGTVVIDNRSRRRAKPAVFFNNRHLKDPNLSILYNLSLANVERIVIDRFSRIPINGGISDGMVRIYTRETPLFKRQANDFVYLSAKTTESFAVGKEYYAPKYASYQNPMFQKYGTIAWIPSVTLTKEAPTSFKIYDTFTKNITLFIEGISENGDLISTKKTIQIR